MSGVLAEGPESAADARRVRVRGAAVRDLYARGLTWVSLAPIPERPSSIDFAIRLLPSIGLISGRVRGVRHDRAQEQVTDGNDDFSIHMNLSGRSMVVARGNEITLRDGDAVLLNYAESRTITRSEFVDYRIARVPRNLLKPLVCNIDDAVARRIPSGSGALSLLTNYVGALIDDPVLTAPDLRRLIVTQLCDLIAITIGATREAAAVAEGRGVRAARLRAVKDDIETHLADDGLSAAAVAKRQGISESYVRKLFEAEGTSFSEFMLSRRLARAFAMLRDRRWANRSIATVSFEAGFSDLSYFNRTFRRCYGATPSEVREAARREDV